MKRAEIVASGTVQGVGFRYHVRALATKLRLAGHVRNMEDGTVEIICEGEQGDIEALVEKIRAMKPPVEVEDVSVAYSDAQGLANFKIIVGDQTQEMVEGFGTGAAYMAMMLGKQDQMLGKQDEMLGKQDEMLGKQDQMLGKQDQTIAEIRALSSSITDMLDSRLSRLEREVSEIKAKLPN